MKTRLFAFLAMALLAPITRAASPSVVLSDSQGISGFELYGNGIFWWDEHGVCGTEFPNDATVRVRGVINGGTHNVERSCEISQGNYNNVVRDDSYAYFFSNRQLMRKAVNAAEADPEQVLVTTNFNPTLRVNQLSSVLELADGVLYWARYTNGVSDFYHMKSDGSEAPHYFLTVVGGAEVKKMKLFRFDDGDGLIDGLAILFGNGKLYRYKFNASGTLNQIANGANDFAIQRRSSLFSSTTYIYAAIGISGVVPQNAGPGFLMRINASGDGSSWMGVYFATGNNQVLSVATDSDESLLFGPSKNIYLAEGVVTCGDLFCAVGDVFIKRHTSPGSTTGWDQIVSTGGGYNLRSDDNWLYFTLTNTIKKISTDAPAQVLDIKADALEVVQAIQDLNSSVRLIADRPTYVRGYAHLATNTTGQSTWFPTAVLYGYLNGSLLPGSPISSINSTLVDSTSDLGTLRSTLNRSFLFELPPEWVDYDIPFVPALLTFNMIVNANHDIPETPASPLANNSVELTQPGQLWRKGWPCIVTVPLLVEGPEYFANGPGFNQILERARSLLPVEDLSVFTYAVTEAVGDPDEPFKIGNADDDVNDEAQSDALDCLEDLDMESDPCEDKDAHYLGMVHPSIPNFNGVSRRDSEVLIARFETNSVSGLIFGGGKSMAHEMGHDYGRRHIACGNFPSDQADFDFSPFPCFLGIPSPSDPSATFGFDYLTFNVINPTNAADLMSYAGNRWISKMTWDAIWGGTPSSFTGESLAEPFAQSAAPKTGESQVLLVRGRVNEPLQLGYFRTFCALDEASAPPARVTASRALVRQLSTLPDNYLLRQLDASGAVRTNTPVRLNEGSNHERHLKFDAFAQYIDFLPTTRVLQLVHTNKLLAERFISANPPSLTIVTQTLDTVAQTLYLHWSASDPDGDPLFFSVQYSPDNGTHWTTLRSGYKPLEITLSTRLLPGSAQARMRVTATDGVLCAMAMTAPFNLPKHAPEPQIHGVNQGQRVKFGTPLRLRGLALDAETGSRSNRLVWNLSGPTSLVATGTFLSLRELPPGTYTAGLTATDPDGQSAATSRQFEILPLTIPDGAAPSLDGLCNDLTYANAAMVHVPVGNGEVIPVHLVHSGSNLFVCFANLKYAGLLQANRTIGLRIETDGSHSTTPSSSDSGFFVDEDGIPFQEIGGRTGMAVAQSPRPGFKAVVHRGTSAWSAEFRIADSLIGGWNHLAGIMFDHDTPHWPPAATDDSPANWASVYLGTNPPAGGNRAPTANAGPDQRVSLRAARDVYLDGSASADPDDQPLQYAWTQLNGPAVTLVNSNTATPRFLASPVSIATPLAFQLVVSDGANSSAPDQVQVTLLPAALAPSTLPQRGYAALRTDGALQFRLIANPGQLYRIESSPDFVRWQTVRTIYADFSGRINFSQVVDFVTNDHLFFRAVSP